MVKKKVYMKKCAKKYQSTNARKNLYIKGVWRKMNNLHIHTCRETSLSAPSNANKHIIILQYGTNEFFYVCSTHTHKKSIWVCILIYFLSLPKTFGLILKRTDKLYIVIGCFAYLIRYAYLCDVVSKCVILIILNKKNSTYYITKTCDQNNFMLDFFPSLEKHTHNINV